MNTSFGNRYANTYFSPNNKGEAMRKMRQGVRLPGWGLPMNGGQTRSATYLNQYAESADDLLKKLTQEVDGEERNFNPKHFLINANIDHCLRQLEIMRSCNHLTPEQERKLNNQISRIKSLESKRVGHNMNVIHQ